MRRRWSWWWSNFKADWPSTKRTLLVYLAIIAAILVILGWSTWSGGPRGVPPDDPPGVCSDHGVGYC